MSERVLDEWLALGNHQRTGTDGLLRPVDDVEGIGPAYAERLRSAGVRTCMDLWMCSPVYISIQTGIPPARLLTWQRAADLMRIDGIGPQYSELLVAAGVRTTQHLAEFEVAELDEKIEAVLTRRPNIVGSTPGATTIKGWILAALTLLPPGAPLDIESTEEVPERGWSWQDPTRSG